MSYEIAGVLATSAIITVLVWFATSLWAIYDSVTKHKGAKWLVLSIVPLAGPLLYHFSLSDGPKSKKVTQILKKYWTVVAIIFIVLLSMHTRLADYRWDYLRNIDSYTFYRSMDEIVQNNGVLPKWDYLVMAPDGGPIPPGIQPYFYLGAYSFMLAKSLLNVSFFQFLIFFPPFLASLATIPVYFIGKMLYDRKAGVIAAFIYVFDINNLARSLGGDPDSDAFIFLVSMTAIAVMLFMYKYSVKEIKFSKNFVLYSAITGIVVWIWFNSWAGYWYIFWLFTGLVIVRLLFDIIESRSLARGLHRSKFVLASYAIYMIVAFTLVTLVFGNLGVIKDAFVGPVQFQNIKGEDSQFPNVYVSVAELQQGGGVQDVIARTSVAGGAGLLISPFFMFIYALLYLMYSYYKRREHIDTLLLLAIWFIGPLMATVIAIRFSVLFSAPLAIGSAIFLSKLIRVASGEDKGVE